MNIEQIFEEFIKVISENPDFIIGLINDEGKILLCSDKKIIDSILPSIENNNTNNFYHLNIMNSNYTYLWVYTEEKSLTMVGNLLYESLKTRIIYETNQEVARKNLSIEDQLITILMNTEEFDHTKIKNLFDKLGISENTPRIVIKIVNTEVFNPSDLTDLKYKINDNETVYSLIGENELLVLKNVSKDKMFFSYKEYISYFIDELKDWGMNNCNFYVGNIQNMPNCYKISYKYCNWIQEIYSKDRQETIFFEDHILDFIEKSTQSSDKLNIFRFYMHELKKQDVEDLIIISGCLYENDYDLNKTSESLFIHKNTLVYKLKKYEDILKFDIRGSFKGKLTFYLLGGFLKEIRETERVGEKYE